MLELATSFNAAQAARTASLPAQLNTTSPVREAVLEAPRQRNVLLDYLFYDLKSVTPEEAAMLAPRWAAEGAILLVPPTGAARLTLCLSIDEFITAGGEGVGAMAVAGVGSSALGSAAFARNVADAIGKPVAAVVSGYGLADLLTEALGGFFWFGALNQLRHSFEILDELSRPPVVRGLAASRSAEGLLARQSKDTETVLALLLDERFSFNLLSGHSKGNLVVSEALYELRRQQPGRAAALGQSATVVTVSARIAMPPAFKRVIDVMGEWDWFGALNSRPGIKADITMPQAWHHTNTELYAHLPVTAALRGVL